MRTAYLFPGQGSQYVGMGEDLARASVPARHVFDRANEVLGFDLAAICFQGPEELLRETRNTQPAIFVHSMAVLAALGWELGGGDCLLAGHSLGEYTAYAAAGALTFEDALLLVRRRGELMWEAGQSRPGTMAAVLGLGGSAVAEAIRNVPGVVVPANLNSSTQVVISGEVAAVEVAMERLREVGAKRVVRLEVSGAFHSPLMAAAAEELERTLAGTTISAPRARVVANASAQPVVDPEGIRASLVRQLTSPVRWEETLAWMIGEGAGRFVEVGPGKVLVGLVRAIDKGIEVQTLGTAEQVQATLDGAVEEAR